MRDIDTLVSSDDCRINVVDLFSGCGGYPLKKFIFFQIPFDSLIVI